MPEKLLSDDDIGVGLLTDADTGLQPAELEGLFGGRPARDPMELAAQSWQAQLESGTAAPSGESGPAPLEVVGEVSSGIMRDIGGMAADWFRRTGIDPSAQPGKPFFNIPRFAKPPPGYEYGPIQERVAGLHSAAAAFAEGLETPEGAATLPAIALKPVQALYAAQAAAAVPEQIKALEEAKTPRETYEAGGGLGLNLWLGKSMIRGLAGKPILPQRLAALARARRILPRASAEAKKGVLDYASKESQATEIHGPVRPSPGEGAGEVPAQEGGAGVRPQAVAEEGRQGVLLNRLRSGEKLTSDDYGALGDIEQRMLAGEKLSPAEQSIVDTLNQPVKTLDKEGQTLVDEASKELTHPVEVVSEVGVEAPFARQRRGQFMGINRKTGKIEIYPDQFNQWLTEDVPANRRAAAVKARLEEEGIHLQTTPGDATSYWNGLTMAEKAIEIRAYTGKWLPNLTEMGLSPRDLGFEAVRRRMQQLSHMESSEIAEAAFRERWTLKGLEAIERTIRASREALGTKASAAQRAITDRMLNNVEVAKQAVATRPTEEQGKPVEPVEPVEPKSWDEPGAIRKDWSEPEQLEGEAEAAYKERIIKSRIESGIAPKDIQLTVFRLGPELAKYDTVQVDEMHPQYGNTFSSNPEQLRGLGMEIPSKQELLKLPAGRYRLPEVRDLLSRGEVAAPAALRRGLRDKPMETFKVEDDALARLAYLSRQFPDRRFSVVPTSAGFELRQRVKSLDPAAIRKGRQDMTGELWLPEAERGIERPVATELGAKPTTGFTVEHEGYAEIQRTTDRMLDEARVNPGAKLTLPTFKGYVESLRKTFGEVQDGAAYESYQRNLYRRLLNMDGEALATMRRATGLETKFGTRPIASKARGVPRGTDKGTRQDIVDEQSYRNSLIAEIALKMLKESKQAPLKELTKVTLDDLREPQSGVETAERTFFDVSTQDLKQPNLAERLTADARRSNSDPVSWSKRLTALLDEQTGKVFLVSTYLAGKRPGHPSTAKLRDPALSRVRNHIPLSDVLKRYRPVASLLLDQPVQGFRQAFKSLSDFENTLGKSARQASQPTYGEMVLGGHPEYMPSTGTGVIRTTPGELQASPGTWQRDIPMTDAEATSIFDHIEAETGKFNSPTDVLDSLFGLKESVNRQALSGYRKLAARIQEQNPDASWQDIQNKLANTIYENHIQAKDFQQFIDRTIQAAASPEARPTAEPGPAPALAGRRPQTGARELTMLRRYGPTADPSRTLPKGPGPVPALPEPTPPELLPGAQREAPTPPVIEEPTTMSISGIAKPAGGPVVRRGRYTLAGGKGMIDIREPLPEPAAIRRNIRDSVEGVKSDINRLLSSWPAADMATRTADAAMNRANNIAQQAETYVRLASMSRPATMLKRYATPWERGNAQVLAAANAMVEAKAVTATGVIDPSAKAELTRFRDQVNIGMQKAQKLAQSTSWSERRIGNAWIRNQENLLKELDYAEAHWDDPALQNTARRISQTYADQLAAEKAAGINVSEREGYDPHRYDAALWTEDGLLFQLTRFEHRILGDRFSQSAKFASYYDASAAGPYLAVTRDSAALLNHRLRQGQYRILKDRWTEGLKSIRMPNGKPLAIDSSSGKKGFVSPDPTYKVVPDAGNMAIHEDYVRLIRRLTSPSAVQDSPLGRAALHFSQQLKHSILVGDLFHLGRMMYYGMAVMGTKVGFKSGWSVLDITERDMPEAVRKGLIRQEDLDWANTQVPFGRGTMTRRQLAEKFYSQMGANLGRVQDALYKELVTNLSPTSGPVRRAIVRTIDPSIGRYNRFLFDKLTRGMMAEANVREFERQMKAKPDASPHQLMADIARDVNNFFGNIGRQGWIKSRTFQDLARITWLAPQWVEGLLKKELVAYGRMSGVASATGLRRGPTALGTTGRAIGRGMLFMFGVTQALNLIFRNRPTWQNPESEHKWDAWIPGWGADSEGFWLSPLAIFNEVTHDLYRLSVAKEDFGAAVAQIAGNKEQPITRSVLIGLTGYGPTGMKLTSTGSRLSEAGKQLVPVPISFGKLARAGAHAAAPSLVSPPRKGEVFRQVVATYGIKIEPASTAAQETGRLAKDWLKKEGLLKTTGWSQVQTDEPSYSKMRAALRNEDMKTARQMLKELQKTHSFPDIVKAMNLWARRPFTGSKKLEGTFMASLSEEQLDQYQKAIEQRQLLLNKFLEWVWAEP